MFYLCYAMSYNRGTLPIYQAGVPPVIHARVIYCLLRENKESREFFDASLPFAVPLRTMNGGCHLVLPGI